MAAIDPNEQAQLQEAPNGTVAPPRATLKILRQAPDVDDEESQEEYMRALLAGDDSEDDSESDEEEEEEANGGPSDPNKSKKARKAAALKQLLDSIDQDPDAEMEDAPNGTNGKNVDKKGKAKATSDDEEESEEESDEDDDEDEIEEFVLCTLDPEKVNTLN